MLLRPSFSYTCTRCLLRQRRLLPSQLRSYSDAPASATKSTAFPDPPSKRAFAALDHRRCLSVSGPDAAKFLQGLTSQNVSHSRTTPWYSAFLNAQGRVLWDTFIYPYESNGDWACLIEVDGRELPQLEKHLKRYKLRSKVAIDSAGASGYNVWAGWDDTGSLSSKDVEQNLRQSDVQVLQDPRAPGLGWRILAASPLESELTGIFENLNINPQYALRRYVQGVPEGPDEVLPKQALPQESNIDFMDGIDFRKGCYVGQELTIRTHHTGVVRKRIVPVQIHRSGDAEPQREPVYQRETAQELWQSIDTSYTSVPSGIEIRRVEEGKKGRSAGKFITGIGNVGLALCRLEMMTDVRLTAEGGMWKEGAQFGVKWVPDAESGEEKELRVKAFVPQWMRQKLEERPQKAQRRVE